MKAAVCLVALVAASVIAAFGLIPVLTSSPPYFRGVVAGLAVAVLVFALLWHAVLSDASMTWRVGALGEFWTAEELRLLGSQWTVMNNLRIPGADGSEREVDHVLVGPGGVHVLDTKLWPSKHRRLTPSDSPDINKAALAARRQAGVVRLSLANVVEPDNITAHVIFWGGDLLSANDLVLTNRDGVRLLHGRDMQAWRESIRVNKCLEPSAIEATVDRLRPYLVPEQRLRDAKPPPDWVPPLGR